MLGASGAHADTIADLKAAVSTLHATTPIRASADIQRSRKSAGRFVNRTSAGQLTIDVILDETGLKIALAPELLARAAREWHEHGADPNKATPTRDALDETQLTDVAEALDYRDRLLDMIAVGHRVVERRVLRNGRSVRMVRLELTPKLPTEATSIWHVKFIEDRLDLWIGDDNLPVAAERIRHGSAGFLFLRGDMNRTDSWTFARVGDHLVAIRNESSFDASGFGERGEGRNVQTLTIR
jgi:hypothetical protein